MSHHQHFARRHEPHQTDDSSTHKNGLLHPAVRLVSMQDLNDETRTNAVSGGSSSTT